MRRISLTACCLLASGLSGCLVIFPTDLVLSPDDLPNGVEGQTYRQTLSTDGDARFWRVIAGSLPPGIGLDQNSGELAGRPSAGGDFTFTVQADEVIGVPRVGQRQYTLHIIAALTVDTILDPAAVGEAYRSSFGVSGGVPPYRFEVIGLPAGLTFDDSRGEIAGTPVNPSVGVELAVTVTDSGDPQQEVTERATLRVRPIEVTITTTSLPRAIFGRAYEATLAATNGLPPLAWAVVEGLLPSGLRLDTETGVISGTPDDPAGGESSITVRATDSDTPATTDRQELTIEVTGELVVEIDLPDGRVDEAYNATITVSGGLAPYEAELTGLPAGLMFEFDGDMGAISGTPEGPAGTAELELTIRDGDDPAQEVSEALMLVIKPLAVVVTTNALDDATVGVAYSDTLESANGIDPVTWRVVSGSLPAGLALDAATGEISGTPTAAGESSFTVEARDSDEPPTSDRQGLTLTVVEP